MAKLPDHFQSPSLGDQRVPREVLAEHQREAVLIRVTGAFAKRGYQATSVDDLLATGKVGVGNFYELFEGKEDCFLAACDRVIAIGRERIAAATADAGGWGEQAYLGLRALLEGFLAEPLEARLVLVEAQSAGAAATGRYNAILDAAIAWLRGGRAHHPTAAGLPEGFEQAAVSGLAFYLQQCLLDSRRHNLGELLEETAGLLLEPIIGAAELARLRQLAAV